MKTLYITRHAKSSWEENVDDHKRPLNSRGKLDIITVSNYVTSNFKKPDLIKTSDANRALTTAQQFKNDFNLPDSKFEIQHSMYDFTGERVIRAIENTSNDVQILMVFGHNYGLTHLVNKLGNEYIDNLPTCGFVQIDFDTNSWKNLSQGNTKSMVFPKHLK
ncbi:histidine phosphatase family protein [uncultured Planktosalinus sp.]|uniref:SixA phosphatase family protein n=1 Tax=uncultured Planktosalinus sp. TaxID=1810935 RepID=UPI0030DB05F0